MRALKEESFYTIDDIYDLPDGQRAELIDGQIYNMAPPSRTHQKLVNLFSWAITNYIRSQKGSCEVYPAPFAVFLNKDEKNYVEPDISVICDPSKLDEKGCHGAPDWIIEITSPSNPQMDYGIKLFKYRSAGVREYWIVDPMYSRVYVYSMEANNFYVNSYSFHDTIKAGIFEDLYIDFSKLDIEIK